MSSHSSKRTRSGAPDHHWSRSCLDAVEFEQLPNCSFPGCKKPAYDDKRWSSNARGGNLKLRPHQFCGLYHRDLFHSDLLERRRCEMVGEDSSSSGSADIGREMSHKCMHPECSSETWRDPETGIKSDFCGKKHMLATLTDLVRTWSVKGKLCQLSDCVRHVFVDEDGKEHKFCSFSHAKLAAAREGLPGIRKSVASGAAGVDTRTNQSCQDVQEIIEGSRGYYYDICPEELRRLLKGEGDAGRDTEIVQGVDIYKFHPWELVRKKQPRYFLHHTKYQDSKKVPRTTKGGCSWKQSSSAHETGGLVTTRYFKYQGKGNDDADPSKELERWKMHQITLDNEPHSNGGGPVIWRIEEEPRSSVTAEKRRSKRARSKLDDDVDKRGDPLAVINDALVTGTNSNFGNDAALETNHSSSDPTIAESFGNNDREVENLGRNGASADGEFVRCGNFNTIVPITSSSNGEITFEDFYLAFCMR